MAASLSRPDPTSPASVAEAGFSTARKGFSTDEVRAFLTAVSAEMRRLQERQQQLEVELRTARDTSGGPVELDEETITSLLGEETVRVLQTARESAGQIKVRAEENAARVLRDANDAATRIRQEAEVDAARRRQDAQSEADAEVAHAKQQGREMVNEARAYRERVLADLERRTKLARQHIEELAHGRDRLLQVFERARLVAVDVTAELQANAGPDEFVSLSPTTGPVPLMVPAAPFAPPSAPTAATAPNAGPAPFDHAGDVVVDDPAPIEHADAADTSETSAGEDTDGSEPTDVVAETEGDGEDLPATDADTPAVDEGEAEADVVDVVDVVAEADVPDEAIAPVVPVRDHNVVALFPGRTPVVVAPDDAVDDAAEGDGEGDVDDAGGDAPRPDVGDLFARLRSEAAPVAEPVIEPVAVEAAEPAPFAAGEHADGEHEDGAGAADDPAVVATPFTRRDEALVPLIVTAARKLKRALADEQNGVLDTLRRKEPVTTLDAIVPAFDVHVAAYAAAIADELIGAAVAGAAELGANDTKTLRKSLDKAGALEGARAMLGTDLVGALRDRIERSVVDGGGDNEDITRRIRAVYREWKTQHIDSQLDDVFRFAFGGGLAITAEPGTPMRWTLDPAEPACADCEDNSLAGAVPAGESFPTGHAAAPAHAGCRCLTLPTRH